MDALTRAMSDVQRSYVRAKQAVAAHGVADIVAGGPRGMLERSNLGQHKAQYDHFRGWQYVCIKAIAQRVARQNLNVARVTKSPKLSRDKAHQFKRRLPHHLKAAGDHLEPIEEHPVLDMFNNPNPLMVSWVLSYVTICSLEITGKAFLWLRDTGKRIELWPLPAHWMTPLHDDGLFSAWEVRSDRSGEAFTLPAEDVVYIALPDPSDPLFGAISPLQSQARAINADESIQTAQDMTFANGHFPRHVVKVGGLPGPDGVVRTGINRPTLTNRQRKQLVGRINDMYRGVLRAGDVFIVDGQIESIEPLSNKPAEMDFLNSGQSTKSRIFQAYGVNPLLVGEIHGANRAQAVVAEESLCSNVINPLLELLSQVHTARTAPRFAAQNERLILWFDPCEATDEFLKLGQWQMAAAKGIVRGNEYRVHVLNLPEDPMFDMPIGAADSLGAMAGGQLFGNQENDTGA